MTHQRQDSVEDRLAMMEKKMAILEAKYGKGLVVDTTSPKSDPVESTAKARTPTSPVGTV